jgi:hypothetical protein
MVLCFLLGCDEFDEICLRRANVEKPCRILRVIAAGNPT